MAKKERSNQFVFLRMELFTRATGLSMRIKKTDVEYKFGQMGPGMMGSGGTEWPTVMADSFMPKAMFMRASGPRIKPMDMEFTLISTEVDMKVNGFKISNMDSVLSNGQMVPSTKVNMSKV